VSSHTGDVVDPAFRLQLNIDMRAAMTVKQRRWSTWKILSYFNPKNLKIKTINMTCVAGIDLEKVLNMNMLMTRKAS
jgi:hypothetical protein